MADEVVPTAPVAPAAAPVTAPVAPAAPAVASIAGAPAVAPASPAPEPALGSQEAPITVPRGTQEQFAKLEAGGYKQEEVDAYLATIPDEATREHVKKALAGEQIFLAEAEIDHETVDPFSPEELADVEALTKDPELLVARIQRSQEEVIKLTEELEVARKTLPEPMVRLLQDPLVKTRLEEIEAGVPFTAQAFDRDTYNQLFEAAFASGDMEQIKALAAQVPDAVEHIVTSTIAAIKAEEAQKAAVAIRQAELTAELDGALDRIATRPEFKSSEPEMLNGQPNLKNPHVAFTDWLMSNMASGTITRAGIEALGGYDDLAMVWFSKNRGGVGKMIHEASNRSVTSYREKMLASRNKALAAGQAAPLALSSGGIQTPLVHGVDIAYALKDDGYSERVSRKLTDSQRAEVAAAMKSMAGMK